MALLPARSELDSADSAFELISENFHSRVSGRAIFGVSGAGPAFTSNEYFFSYIYSYVSGIGSEFSTSDDKPRHIEYFQNQLLLGYENGSVLLGSAGDPMGFDASLGSANIPSGSPVTGLLSIKGQDIAVFSRERIQALQFGGAMSVQNLKTISHNTGAIEYTVRDLGGIPVFLDFRGINTLQNVEAYGDFNRGRLTEMVAPYFVERIQDQPLTDSEPVNVAGVCVVRAKNQYRVFFKDGNTLTMTLRDAQGAPEFTTQFYAIDSATEAAGMAFRHFSEGISDSGRDRVFMVTDDSRYVYELERGISFDGYAIAWSFELNPLFIDGPHVHKEFSRAHLGGEFYTHNTLDVTLGKNNTPPNYPTDSRTLDFGDLPDFSEGTYQIYEAKFPLHGYGQRLRFHGSSAVQFPFLLQSLTLFTTDTKLTG